MVAKRLTNIAVTVAIIVALAFSNINAAASNQVGSADLKVAFSAPQQPQQQVNSDSKSQITPKSVPTVEISKKEEIVEPKAAPPTTSAAKDESKQLVESVAESKLSKKAAEDAANAEKSRKARADEQSSPSALTSAASNSANAEKQAANAAAAETAKTASDAKQAAVNAKLDSAKINKPTKASGLNGKVANKKSSHGSSSTGNSGSYLSKHDSYSAIAERHLFTDAMRKSDRRRFSQSSGIDKASSIGNMFNPLNGITDNGLARSK